MQAMKLFDTLYQELPSEKRTWSSRAAFVMVCGAVEEDVALRQACADDTLTRADVAEAMSKNPYTSSLDVNKLSDEQFLCVCAILKGIVKSFS